jgi:hypothetical protein
MILLGDTGLVLCSRREERRPGHNEMVAILQRCRTDPAILFELRALLHERAESSGVNALSEDGLLEEIASLILSGEFLVFGRQVRRFGRSEEALGSRRDTAPVPSARQQAPARTATSAPPEPPTISRDANPVLLVAAMRSASESGAPFCDT